MHYILRRIFFCAILCVASSAYGDYEQSLRGQVKALLAQYSSVELNALYFKQVGLLARKADDIEAHEFLTEIVKTHLFKKMDQFVETELEAIHTLYSADTQLAAKKYAELTRYDKVYQPTDEFLNTASGQGLAAELVRHRQNALRTSQKTCQTFAVRDLLKALRKTGLFETNRLEEISSVREIQQMLDCCMNWKNKIQYRYEREFSTDYEKGSILEIGELRLQSDRRDMSQAQWAGSWTYQFFGREGEAEGRSQATLKYQKGQELALLVISPAKLVSEGRINFPLSPAGEKRELDVEGKRMAPEIRMNEEQTLFITGCKED